MLFPKNGRVVVLDDKVEQGLPLVKAFSKMGIPCSYFTGTKIEMPKKPFDDIRILALDINLTDGSNFKNTKSMLITCMKAIVSKESKYIVLIWSVKENEFTTDLDALFDKELRDICPVARIPLHKKDYFVHTAGGDYRPRGDLIRKLNKLLSEKLKSNSILALMIVWENLIHECAGSIIRKFSGFIEKDSCFDGNLRHIFYKMAHAQVGRNLKEINKAEVLKNGLRTFNDTFADEINSALIMKNINRAS